VDPSARGEDFRWPPAGTSRGHQRRPQLAATGDLLMAMDSRGAGGHRRNGGQSPRVDRSGSSRLSAWRRWSSADRAPARRLWAWPGTVAAECVPSRAHPAAGPIRRRPLGSAQVSDLRRRTLADVHEHPGSCSQAENAGSIPVTRSSSSSVPVSLLMACDDHCWLSPRSHPRQVTGQHVVVLGALCTINCAQCWACTVRCGFEPQGVAPHACQER
jgi:hypothetical protein